MDRRQSSAAAIPPGAHPAATRSPALHRSVRRYGYARACHRAMPTTLRASPFRAPHAGCGRRNRCAGDHPAPHAGFRSGAGTHPHRGRNAAGAHSARARQNRRSCTAPATKSCGCRYRVRQQSTPATSRPDRHRRDHPAGDAGNGTRTRWCSRLPAFPHRAAWPPHRCFPGSCARRSGTWFRARSRNCPAPASGIRPGRPWRAGRHANAGWRCRAAPRHRSRTP